MTDFLSRIAESREARVQNLHLDLPIPSWGGDLVGRFLVISRKDMEKFAGRKAGSEADMDFIIKATHELYALDTEGNVEGERMEDNEDYVRVEDDHGNAVLWTSVLAEKIGQAQLTRSREVLEYCFRGNLIAVSGFAMKLFRWMQNTDSEVAEAISGE